MEDKFYEIGEWCGSQNLHLIYLDLKENMLKTKPINKSNSPLITINDPNWRGCSYKFELYRLEENELVLVEIYGGVKAYDFAKDHPVKINKKTRDIDKINLSIHNPKGETLSKIEKTLLTHLKRSEFKISKNKL